MDRWGLCFLIASLLLMFHFHLMLSGVSWYDSFEEDGYLIVPLIGIFIFSLWLSASIFMRLTIPVFEYVQSLLRGEARYQRERTQIQELEELKNDDFNAKFEKVLIKRFVFFLVILYYPSLLLWIKFLDWSYNSIASLF